MLQGLSQAHGRNPELSHGLSHMHGQAQELQHQLLPPRVCTHRRLEAEVGLEPRQSGDASSSSCYFATVLNAHIHLHIFDMMSPPQMMQLFIKNCESLFSLFHS